MVLNPTGLCECGCGQLTNVALQNFPKRGYVKGDHFRFLLGHRRDGWSEAAREKARSVITGKPRTAEVKRKLSEHHKAAGIRPSREAIDKSNEHRGKREKSPSWKGGISYVNGYRCIYIPEHPRAHPNGYVYEHIVIAEQTLGRPLEPGEVVHHEDRVKANNSPDNLRVFISQSEHIRHHRVAGDIG